ncbi:MAG: DUF4124 domain-containing protein [Pseudomonadota bacterium]
MSFRMLAGAVLALSCSLSWAQVYQWRDAEGKLHFTDTPPPESQKVEERRLQVNTMEALKPVEESSTDEPGSTTDSTELNAGQLQQKAQMQCSTLVQRMPGLMDELDKYGRTAVKEGRVTEQKYEETMGQMKTMHEEVKRDSRVCAAAYEQEKDMRMAVDCIADSPDAVAFAFCVYFPTP